MSIEHFLQIHPSFVVSNHFYLLQTKDFFLYRHYNYQNLLYKSKFLQIFFLTRQWLFGLSDIMSVQLQKKY